MYNLNLNRADVINIGVNILRIELEFNERAGITLEMNDMPEFFKAVTGWDLTTDDLFEIGDRISTIRMAFNLREGINPLEDFKIPGRVIGHPPVKSGPQKGVEIDLNTMVREYLSAMDWDQVTFKPSRNRLEQLGLEDVAEVLLTDES